MPLPKAPEATTYTYKELLAASYALAERLKALKPVSKKNSSQEDLVAIPPGSKVLLVYPPSPSFLVSFISLLLIDCVPVPVFPPDPMKLKVDAGQFASIVESAGATVALTNSAYNYAKKVIEMGGRGRGVFFCERFFVSHAPFRPWASFCQSALPLSLFAKKTPEYRDCGETGPLFSLVTVDCPHD